MRAVPRMIALLCGVLIAGCTAIATGEEKPPERQAKACDHSYDRCVQAADDWYERSDRSKVENSDVYDQMIDGCRTRRMWCKEDIETTSAPDDDADRPSQSKDMAPEPLKHWPRAGQPRTGGSRKN